MNGHCVTEPNLTFAGTEAFHFTLIPLSKAYVHGWQAKGDALELEIIPAK